MTRHIDEVRNRRGESTSATGFGIPEHSALTIEGRIERATAVATHATRVRDGAERPLRSSYWMHGLLLIAVALGFVLALAVVMYLVG
jgi:hypothetical protein